MSKQSKDMKTKLSIIVAFLLIGNHLIAQFHTLKRPHASPRVIEKQLLGITEIEVDYSAPLVKGRDVWNDPSIVPQNGNPFPWRAGANMNTTISFSTDVKIENHKLKAGTYGIHIIPDDDVYTVMFAHNHHQWGSYYVDEAKDVSLKIKVKAESCTKSEQLDFEFLERTKNCLVIGLEWDEKRIPFKVEVDLNKTVVESFRSELRGLNTYRWEAWNDAARWCLNNNTNLEEALVWVNRSINGGLKGYAANKNKWNLRTKIRLLEKLGKHEEKTKTEAELRSL